MERTGRAFAKFALVFGVCVLAVVWGWPALRTVFHREEPDPLLGKQAPEVAGVDADAAKFKLSDYRGKVVLLDFWGNW
jgi:hypothetical protein